MRRTLDTLVDVTLVWGLVTLLFLTIRGEIRERQRLATEGEPPISTCEVVGVDDLPERQIGVRGGVTMPYPGGLHYRISCANGVVYHLRVPRE